MKPIETLEDRPLGARKSTHPAFAQVNVSRVTGQRFLYGSDFTHHNYLTLTIKKSEVRRSLSHEWFFGNGDIIEVAMSEAQWATMISTLNVGDGTPCTLTRLDCKSIPEIEPTHVAADDFKDEVSIKSKEAARLVDATIAKVEAELNLSQKKKKAILAPLVKLRQELGANLPFVVETFGKHMETQVEKAKIEVSSYVQGAISRAGLEALQAPVMPLLASDANDSKEREDD